MSIKNGSPQTRTSHPFIKSNEGRDNENLSYSHQVNLSLKPPIWELLIFSSMQILKGEVMRTSHILIKSIEAWSPPNENFSSSHHVYQKWQPPKRELLIFSSSPILKGEIMRTSHILIKLLEAPKTRTSNLLIMSIKLQASINLMRRWEVLIISPFKIRLDEKMRSSCLQGCHFW